MTEISQKEQEEYIRAEESLNKKKAELAKEEEKIAGLKAKYRSSIINAVIDQITKFEINPIELYQLESLKETVTANSPKRGRKAGTKVLKDPNKPKKNKDAEKPAQP